MMLIKVKDTSYMKQCLAVVVLVLAAVIMVGCGSTSCSNVGLAVKNASEARDRAFEYVQEDKGVQVPSSDMNWRETDVAPPGLKELSNLVYTSDQWVITVSHSNVDPSQRLYEVVVANVSIGFKWKGIIKSDGEVMEIAISP
jgi:hypothetical protein